VDLNKIFVDNLNAVIKERKLSKRSVFIKCRISATHLDGILLGHHGLTLKTVVKISEGLNIDPIAMLEELD